MWRRLLVGAVLFGWSLQAGAHLRAEQLAVVINTADRLSVAIGAYYIRRRHIPAANVVRVAFNPDSDELPVSQFNRVKSTVDGQIPSRVQAFALTWAKPYRVACMSITSAFAFGFDSGFCASGCNLTRQSPYFNSAVARPYDMLHVRPAMSIAAVDLVHAKELIDRGIRSDGTQPRGVAYLVTTKDEARNVRSLEYTATRAAAPPWLKMESAGNATASGPGSILFYFTGAERVNDLDGLRFLPGAVADHLTSFGGRLTDSSQMSSLRWLEAGATGSYGTVVEPCNLLPKFPFLPVLIGRYVAGDTLLEAYWKSVAMPGQGIFIGEPLAAPFGRP